jgi:hypothetical protein
MAGEWAPLGTDLPEAAADQAIASAQRSVDQTST